MMNRQIRKVAVLGSGIMGSRIACHFANIGLEVLLLDIIPRDLSEIDLQSSAKKNSLVNTALQAAIKSNPAPLYHTSFASKIKTGNFDDDLPKIKDYDWIIEVVIERLDIKQQLYEKVELYRTPGTLISSNTSGIPIHLLIQNRSEDFQKHFCGTHFFNPPRYLKLLEIIPTKITDPSIVNFFETYGSKFLGKTTVVCKDTPAFIANRIGVFSMATVFNLQKEMGLTISEIDALTGTIIGKPKSATFRTADVVGLDTLIKVSKGIYEYCPNDEARNSFQIPESISKMEANNWLGDKTGQGFYKKSIQDGQKVILELDLNTMEYRLPEKTKFKSVAEARMADSLRARLKLLHKAEDQAGVFLRKMNFAIFNYISNRIPEISDELYRIDDAMKAGFGWDIGPFEHWDILGVESCLKEMKEQNMQPAAWVEDMLVTGHNSFYNVLDGVPHYYDISSKSYIKIPGRDSIIILNNQREKTPVFKNSGCIVHDIGDGVLCLEFRTKMNTIGGEVLEGINKAIEIAENEGWKGVVLGNNGVNFTAGANLGMVLMQAIEQEWDDLNFAVSYFQKTVMRIRHSSIPVVSAPHGLTLGGGCEISMHSDACVSAAETYIGLVEVGVGIIPAGCGTKEFALRLSDSFGPEDTWIPKLSERFTTIATAKVGTSAYEGYDLGVFQKSKDSVIVNGDHAIYAAKNKVLELHTLGYTQPILRDDILVLGRTGLGALYAGIASFQFGNYASEHDALISKKLAYVLCGGDLSEPSKVSEQYLLDLEREAFLSLCGEKKTLERMQSILNSGKPLRN